MEASLDLPVRKGTKIIVVVIIIIFTIFIIISYVYVEKFNHQLISSHLIVYMLVTVFFSQFFFSVFSSKALQHNQVI